MPRCNFPAMPAFKNPPILTLLSDFGMDDPYVAAMKLAMLRYCPAARLIDATHNIPPQDVLAGSIALERMMRDAPANCVHLAVVDPGVGTERAGLIARIVDQWVVAPDNGLITWAWRRLAESHPARKNEAWHIKWHKSLDGSQKRHISNVFHGRDIFAPVASLLARGDKLEHLGTPVDAPVLLEALHPSTGPDGKIIHFDHYGNAATNIVDVGDAQSVRLPDGREIPLVRTYAHVAMGEPLALVSSAGLLELAVRNGSARASLQINAGDSVRLVT